MSTEQAIIETFVGACRKVAEYKLVSCSSGNISCRLRPDTALLSGSGAWLAELTPERVAMCSISTGRALNDVAPTCESAFHLGILKHCPEIKVVLHFQSPYATAIACGPTDGLNFNMTIEVPVYIGTPAVVPYLPPGSPELAEAVVNVFKDSQTYIAILTNHGLVSVGTDFNDAIQKAVFLEMACRIILTNPNAKPLDADTVRHLRANEAKA